MCFFGEERAGIVVLGDYAKQLFEVPVAFFDAVASMVGDNFNAVVLRMREGRTTNLDPKRWCVWMTS